MMQSNCLTGSLLNTHLGLKGEVLKALGKFAGAILAAKS